MSKPEFDWAKLNKFSILKAVSGCRKSIVNKPLPIKEIHAIFTSHLKSYFPVKVKKTTATDTELGCVYIGGMYYSGHDIESKPCIEVVFQYSLFDEILTINSALFSRIANTIADTLLHEMIHMKQYRSRKFKVLPDYASTAEKRKQRLEQGYLGCTDEIDAYSFNIACELNDKFKGNGDAIVEYLNKVTHRKVRRPSTWIKYLTAFDNDHNHRIIKRAKKRIIHYIPYAKVGSPFKPSDRLRQSHH
jgi:hypothetical protein